MGYLAVVPPITELSAPFQQRRLTYDAGVGISKPDRKSKLTIDLR